MAIDYGNPYMRDSVLKRLREIAADPDHASDRVYPSIIGCIEALLTGDPEMLAAINTAFEGPNKTLPTVKEG